MAQEKIPVRNAMDAHAQDFLANDKLLLPILKAFVPRPLNTQCTRSLVQMLDVLGQCVAVACVNSSPLYNQLSPAPHQTCPHLPAEIFL